MSDLERELQQLRNENTHLRGWIEAAVTTLGDNHNYQVLRANLRAVLAGTHPTSPVRKP